MAKDITADETALISLYKNKFHEDPKIRKLTGGGSNRRYFRLFGKNHSVIGVIGEDIKENEAFLNLDRLMEEAEIRVPHIFNVSKNKMSYLLQDLGDTNLLSVLSSRKKMCYAKEALVELIKIQLLPKDKWERIVFNSPLDGKQIKWDLNYFKYDFLKVAGIAFDESSLEEDFDKLEKQLLSQEMITGLMYRDFQSRNVMVKEGKLWFIDFQGARLGPLAYDAVSFIWQAKAPFNNKEREVLKNYYSEKLSERIRKDKDLISSQFDKLVVFRTLQVLGAYGFRGLIEKKPHFIESIPSAVSNLKFLRKKGYLNDFKEIKKVCLLIEKWEEARNFISPHNEGELTVTVFSFSYKKGYPEDNSGNGGGFMFDCRALHNPGRYERYKSLNGLDNEVKEFLERTEETKIFIDKSLELVIPSVECYLKRKFTSLQVGFGCTGGQHRSVYCAQKFAKRLKEHFPDLKIKIIHREQEITRL